MHDRVLSVLLGQRIRIGIVLSIATLLVSSVALFVIGYRVAAVDNSASNSANTLKVSPVRTDIEIPAGSTKTVDTYLSNLTDAPITVRPVTNDFIAGDERGTPALILDPDKYAPTHSLKRFMAPLDDVTIPAKESVTVKVIISVPKDAQAGGYFGAVRFAPTSPDGGGQINLSASVASLILMTVPGPTVEKMTLTDFDIQQGGKKDTFFSSSNDIEATFRFESKSNVQVAPQGKISVKQGDKVVYAYDFNQNAPRDMVLPDSARRWDVPLKNLGSFGHYTVYATLTYGKSNQTVETSKSFWVIPWLVIIIAVAAVLLVVGIIVAIIFNVRKRKRRVRLNRDNHHGGGQRRY